jgi:hypothetical protein
MNPSQILTGQIFALERSLGRAKESVTRQGQEANSKLLRRVHGRFENDLLGLRNRCLSLSKRIANEDPGEAAWAQFGKLQAEAWELMKECLAFLEGALVRKAGIDGGVCDLADAMLYELSEKTDMCWQRFTLAAAGEFFSTISGIIRLRYTDTDIWNLPIAAHEFGHFVSSTGIFKEEFDEITRVQKGKKPSYESHLRELFSDLFATYALGPSLVLNCALLRFSPVGAYQEASTHPSASQRIWWMLETLAKMDESEGNPTHNAVAAEVKEAWTAAVKAAGENEVLSDDEISRLRGWLAELYDLVDSRIPGVRYRSFLRAQEYIQAFRNDQGPQLRDEDQIPDVLNGAWGYRLGAASAKGYEVDQIGKKAFAICATISRR